ncbi:MAG: S41 family peptidase [Prevotella sp.]|nr:S41 family peptidase [Bacteroides sp.]MCM1366926.1 S41 family peptidase [Prevotella sp.]MCM1437457.1 S41 family peptidase [Prevotella sp.]
MKLVNTRILLPAVIGIGVAVAWGKTSEKSHDAAVSRNLNTFNSLVKELELNYVDSIRTDEAFEIAIDAMLSTVDPYTEYYNSEERKQLETMTTGEYGGIGSYIIERDGHTYISEPYEGSPAAESGLKAGDWIIRVDTTDTRNMKSAEVTKLLRGVPGSRLTVQVQRPYVSDSIRTVEIERRKLVMPSVPYYGLVDGNTGYIKLTSFMDKSAEEVKEALEAFKKNPEVKSLVLDLRGNGGGLLEAAVDILGYFVPKGTEVLRTKGKSKSSEKIYKTQHQPIMPDIPMVVLIDGGSASASEITAGALQDLDRAVLVGTRSYGKGLVQSTRPLPYEGLLKVTVAKYYIPSGRLIQALDYSRRNPDGTVARTPDSLTNVYHTAAGREVRDGGGLTPDVEVKWDDVNRLVFNVVRDNWAFDFATKYASEHESIPSPEEFEITDEIYSEFKKSIDPARFKYDKVCEDMVKTLTETAETEGYMNEGVKAQLDTLRTLLTHNLDYDLDHNRSKISPYLVEEIMGRYYYQRGKVIGSLRDDEGLKKAEEILGNPVEYRKILGHKK